ncbi:hypothetical protein [Methyloferula stellata]|nr:hypothetical protein [Methyloferula stellata]
MRAGASAHDLANQADDVDFKQIEGFSLPPNPIVYRLASHD